MHRHFEEPARDAEASKRDALEDYALELALKESEREAEEAEAQRRQEQQELRWKAQHLELEEALDSLDGLDVLLRSCKRVSSSPGPSLAEAQQLAEAVRGDATLKRVDVHRCDAVEVVQVLAEALHGSSVLDLRLWEGTLGDRGLEVLAPHLKNSSLRRLCIPRDVIGPRGAEALAFSLPFSQLTNLQLEGNHLGDEGLGALACALPRSRLRVLGLQSNNITCGGIKALAATLKSSLLVTLDLSLNSDIGSYGAKLLAESLPGSGLRELRLLSCGIFDAGAIAFGPVLRESMLMTLCLAGNRIERVGHRALLEGMRGAPTKVLDPSGRLPGDALESNEGPSLVLQVSVQGTEDMRTLTFRTLGGSVSAVLELRTPVSEKRLQEAVFGAMRRSGFRAPGCGPSSLRFVWPNPDIGQALLRQEGRN